MDGNGVDDGGGVEGDGGGGGGTNTSSGMLLWEACQGLREHHDQGLYTAGINNFYRTENLRILSIILCNE